MHYLTSEYVAFNMSATSDRNSFLSYYKSYILSLIIHEKNGANLENLDFKMLIAPHQLPMTDIVFYTYYITNKIFILFKFSVKMTKSNL